MQTAGFFFYIGLIFIFYISSFSIALPKFPVPVSRRGLTTLKNPIPDPEPNHLLDDIKIEVDPSLVFDSPRLKTAYFVFQEWKKVILSDPLNMTGNWVGTHVCSYLGVVCALALDDESIVTVAVIDLNFGDIAGELVPHLGLLSDLAIVHLHSNRFFGLFPKTLSNLKLLFELDLSNNRFVGTFPSAILSMTSLRFLDIRFNEFEGTLPPEIFDMDIDALIVNNNRFYSHLPKNMGNSPASTLVLSNNKFSGCIPRSVGQMQNLEQASFANNRLTGCLPEELGMLKFLDVLDVSKNYFLGPLPSSLGRLKLMEKIDFSWNQLTGKVDDSICNLPALWNITINNNFFNEIGAECEKLVNTKFFMEDRENCFSRKPNQRPEKDCVSVLSHPVDCRTIGCQPRDPDIVRHKNRKSPPSPPPPPLGIRSPPKPKPPPVPP